MVNPARLQLVFVAVLSLWLSFLGCNVDTGDLTVTVVKSWRGEEDPFAVTVAKWVRVRVDGPGLLVGPTEFSIKDKRGTLTEVEVGDNRRITVEGLGFEKNVVSRGRTGPLRIEEGDNSFKLYVGLTEDPGTFSYTPVKELHARRAFHSATLLEDGSVLLSGGITGTAPPWRPEDKDNQGPPSPVTATMERIDGNSLEVVAFSPTNCTPGSGKGCMVSARVGHSATLLQSGNVLFAGGLDDAGKEVKRVEVFSSEDNLFAKAGALTSPRAWHCATPTNDGALVVGGHNNESMNLSGELFTAGTVSVTAGLQDGRRAFTLTVLSDGTLVAAGGLDSTGGSMDSIEILSPGGLKWKRSAARLKVPRAYHTATVREDDTILFVGGRSMPKGDATTTIELYDPRKDASYALPAQLRQARWAHTATLLTNGRVLVLGGFAPDPVQSVEQIQFFEGGVTQVRPLAQLLHPRAGHTATRLQSGFVLIVGGISGGQISNTMEVFVY